MPKYLVSMLKADDSDGYDIIDNDKMSLPRFNQPTVTLESAVQSMTEGQFMDDDDIMDTRAMDLVADVIKRRVEDLEDRFEDMVDEIVRDELDEDIVNIDDLIDEGWNSCDIECNKTKLESAIENCLITGELRYRMGFNTSGTAMWHVYNDDNDLVGKVIITQLER